MQAQLVKVSKDPMHRALIASLVMLIAFLVWPIQWPLQLKLFLIVISAMFVWMADHLTNGLGAEEAFIDLEGKTAKIGTRLDAMEPIIDRSVKILTENLTHVTLRTKRKRYTVWATERNCTEEGLWLLRRWLIQPFKPSDPSAGNYPE